MRRSYDHFKLIMQDTKNIDVLYSYLSNQVKPPYDYSDLLRWQWAQSVSAFDKLIHDFVRVGMLQIFVGTRTLTNAYSNFCISIDLYNQMTQNTIIASQLFEQAIIKKNGYLAFQDPDKISDALAYIWNEPHKWQTIAVQTGRTASDEKNIRIELRNIITRRNQIVHEGDYSDLLFQRQEITENDVNDVIVFIEGLAEAIYNLVK